VYTLEATCYPFDSRCSQRYHKNIDISPILVIFCSRQGHSLLKTWECNSFFFFLWLCSPLWTLASLMILPQICLYTIRGLGHLRFPNSNFFTVWACQPHSQPRIWRTRPLYLYSPEAGWPSYTHSHQIPILVTS
jgi:hypothetical protein